MKNKKLLLACKYTLYVVLLILLYVLQTTPYLFELYSIKPILLIPAAIYIAMREGEFVGGLFGAFTGLLMDLSTTPIFGFYAILMLLVGVGVGLCVIYLMRLNFANYLLFTLAALFFTGFLNFFFCYLIWGYDGVWKIFLYQVLPTIAYSMLVSPLFFWLFGRIYRFFENRLES